MKLVAAYPRSGTGFVANLLNASGLKYGHETVQKDGAVSWLHISPGGRVSWLDKEIEAVDFEEIIHLVRDPLAAISSAQTLADETFEYMFNVLGSRPEGCRGPIWYMWTWLKWNGLIEGKASKRVCVEDLNTKEKANDFLAYLGGAPVNVIPDKWNNSRRHSFYTWENLEAADAELCKKIKYKAAEYGYQTHDKLTLGAVMMGKNEEELLPRCLESLQGVVDEIVFVDTGSTDSTIEIAKKYGCKIIVPENLDALFIEIDGAKRLNFSAGRNETLKHSTCDWVLVIDCDEELCGNKFGIKTALRQLESRHDGAALVVDDMAQGEVKMRFTVSRLFKRGKVHFEDIVHNQPVIDTDVVLLQDAFIQHYGYDLPPEKMNAKFNRSASLLRKRLADNPQDFSALFYLAQLYGTRQDLRPAYDCIMEYISHKDEIGSAFNLSSYYTALQLERDLNGLGDGFEKLLGEALAVIPDDLDCNFIGLKYAEQTKKPRLLRDFSEKFLAIYDDFIRNPIHQGHRFVYTFTPEHLALATFHAATQELRMGAQFLEKFKEITKKLPEPMQSAALKDMEAACKDMKISWISS